MNGLTRAMLYACAMQCACIGGAPRLTIDGSSTLFPLAEIVVERQHKDVPGLEIVARVSGTGAGLARLCRGEVEVAMSSRPMNDAERAACAENGVKPIAFDVASDAIAVVVHPTNDFVSTMTLEELGRAWQPQAERRVVTWRSLRPSWPSAPMQLYGAGAFSGTFDLFTRVAVGHERASRGDVISSEDDGVLLHGVANDPRALGFFGLSVQRRAAGKTKLVAIDFGHGAVSPSEATVADGSYGPLSRRLAVYADEHRLRSEVLRTLLARFVNVARADVERAGLLPLPSTDQSAEIERLRQELHE